MTKQVLFMLTTDAAALDGELVQKLNVSGLVEDITKLAADNENGTVTYLLEPKKGKLHDLIDFVTSKEINDNYGVFFAGTLEDQRFTFVRNKADYPDALESMTPLNNQVRKAILHSCWKSVKKLIGQEVKKSP